MNKAVCVCLILFVLVCCAAALRPGQTQTISKATTSTTIPDKVTLSKTTINSLLNDCYRRCSDRVGAYQAGCADTCDYVLDLTGIRQKKYSSAPSTYISQNQENLLCFKKTSAGYYSVPAGTHTLEYEQNGIFYNITMYAANTTYPYPHLGPGRTLNYFSGLWRIWTKK